MLQFHMPTQRVKKHYKKTTVANSSKTELNQLINQLKKQNSFVYQFALSIVKGFGNMIGASIVFGLLGWWISAHLHGIIEWVRHLLLIKLSN